MLLRTRITLLLSLALIFMIFALIGLGFVRARLSEAQLADIAIAGQQSLWESLVSDQAEDLIDMADRFSFRVTNAPASDENTLEALIDNSADLLADGLTVQLLSTGGEILASNAPTFRTRPILGPPALARLLDGHQAPGGLRQETPSRYVVAGASVAVRRNGPPIVVVLMVDALSILTELSERLGEPSYLVSLRGRMVAGTDPALFSLVAPQLPHRTADAQIISVDDRLFFAAGVPVPDLMGPPAGQLVTLRDATDSLSASRQLERTGVIGISVASLVLIVALYVFLRRAFAPLEASIGTLSALSKGDLNELPTIGGSGEIRRIGEALLVFRRNALRLVEQEERIARQRRRQERVIKRQLERLAGTLDPEGQEAIQADLRAILSDPDGTGSAEPVPAAGQAARPNEELAMLTEVLQRMSQRISAQHRRLTELIAELQAAIITRARLAGLEQELEIARELQLSFLPKPLPPHPAFTVDGFMETAKEVGGDFFDYFMIDERRLGVVVADVSGKGVAAALFMAITRTLIKATAMTGSSPAETLKDVNDFLAEDNDQMMFVTLFHGVIDLPTRTMRYANAGHNPPLLTDLANGVVTELPSARDPALAVVEGLEFEEMVVQLEPGIRLFMFTDGVTEAFNAGEEAFGDARLQAVVRAADEDEADLNQVVHNAVIAFEGGAERADDLTCVTLHIHPSLRNDPS
ncbi:PP2C family protein-serine/threonine phosphatase [Acuticoccus sp. I52.16.1]|uniref:PP2C family protein-serine/threonine phosphatase n=1 Tax=Acuticoccus sp. I52.16.1 TaxID=2928472 RepID=UPI001FD04F71|nr:PP2C family protein-serine/threonine phosphatase [Acuticoccus sp. I52.16.1]UOM32911.1 PP2C family protein-serine/threonine phosphatase [Acuticoccus sp. I52.16.1]